MEVCGKEQPVQLNCISMQLCPCQLPFLFIKNMYLITPQQSANCVRGLTNRSASLLKISAQLEFISASELEP